MWSSSLAVRGRPRMICLRPRGTEENDAAVAASLLPRLTRERRGAPAEAGAPHFRPAQAPPLPNAFRKTAFGEPTPVTSSQPGPVVRLESWSNVRTLYRKPPDLFTPFAKSGRTFAPAIEPTSWKAP